MADDAEKPAERDPKTGHFLAGDKWAGNRAGRPKGSNRQDLAREFIQGLQKAWTKHGDAVLDKLAEEDPATLVRALVAIVPKEIDLTVNRFDDMTLDQLKRQHAELARTARALGLDIGAGDASGLH